MLKASLNSKKQHLSLIQLINRIFLKNKKYQKMFLINSHMNLTQKFTENYTIYDVHVYQKQRTNSCCIASNIYFD